MFSAKWMRLEYVFFCFFCGHQLQQWKLRYKNYLYSETISKNEFHLWMCHKTWLIGSWDISSQKKPAVFDWKTNKKTFAVRQQIKNAIKDGSIFSEPTKYQINVDLKTCNESFCDSSNEQTVLQANKKISPLNGRQWQRNDVLKTQHTNQILALLLIRIW